MLVLEVEGVLVLDCPSCCHLVASCRECQILQNSQTTAFSYSGETDPQALGARPSLG